MGKQIILTEVGPRDGFHNESKILDTATKVALIEASIEAGFKEIEFGYFTNLEKAPSLADVEMVYEKIKHHKEVKLKALIEDAEGLSRAVDAGVKQVKMSVSASNTYNMKKFNMSNEEKLRAIEKLVQEAMSKKIQISCAVSTSFGCPYEGKMTPSKIDTIASRLVEMGIQEIYISDTAGMGNPAEAENIFGFFLDKYPDRLFSAHFHDTRGMGLANVYAAIKVGVRRFDSSFGGLGGCPYVPGGKGNVSSEDLIHMLEEMGYQTGIDLDKAIQIGKKLETIFEKPMNSYVLEAGKSSELIRT